jgi:hypothetical protein
MLTVLIHVTKDRIYKCRQAYTDSLVSDISDYRQTLLEATDTGAKVSGSVCNHPTQASLCAAEQLRILNDWIKTNRLRIAPRTPLRNSLWISRYRSPLEFFDPAPDTESLSRLHQDDRQGECGLTHLVATMQQDGKMRLLQWMTESGMGGQIATEEHIAYMAEQKRKLSG